MHQRKGREKGEAMGGESEKLREGKEERGEMWDVMHRLLIGDECEWLGREKGRR